MRPAIRMIGEMIGELTGNVIGQRIVRHYGREPKLERTIELKGKLLGTEVTVIATFWSKERSQGGVYSEGSAIVTTNSGETATVHASGISVPKEGPGWSMRGVRYLQTTSPALSRLNTVALVFEVEIAPDGTIRDKTWEWK
jgi:hypothetical protein